MISHGVHERIRELLARVLELESAQLPDDPTPERLGQWDSVHHLELMVVLEEEFGVEIPAEVAPALISVDAIATFLSSYAEQTRTVAVDRPPAT